MQDSSCLWVIRAVIDEGGWETLAGPLLIFSRTASKTFHFPYSTIATSAEICVHFYDSTLFDFNLHSIHALITHISKCVMLLGTIHPLQRAGVEMLTVVLGKVAKLQFQNINIRLRASDWENVCGGVFQDLL